MNDGNANPPAVSNGLLPRVGQWILQALWIVMLVVVVWTLVTIGFVVPSFKHPISSPSNGTADLQGYGWPWVYRANTSNMPVNAVPWLERYEFPTSYMNYGLLGLDIVVIACLILATGASSYSLAFRQFRFRLSSLLLLAFVVAATWKWGVIVITDRSQTAVFPMSVNLILLWTIGCTLFVGLRTVLDYSAQLLRRRAAKSSSPCAPTG